ncbi:MAG: DUF86 domain-containing protein [Deltaproteobacteria bacterium]|nr:DUF86 domain-containing protein [Deltaproteobacteria bacterium]MBW1931285.1 DUF86 domain-containing protein [Deltaproteobacteria bacterium]MBW2027214.1 DUF86 domain-containing protein [Deltaproteobacteria bacterium]MBW2126645.1 DUF86 domain-containing protein [Deltaproteobacteria bacterium]RLB11155.1 MAG: hypothetical protein DRG63_13220 [Deltaproteobacteria bacterium]
MPELDVKRLKRYCLTIQENIEDICYLLSEYSDQELLGKRYLLKSLKYSLVEVAEAMANTLQHMLAKLKGEAAESYLEVAEKARRAELMDVELLGRLLFFFKFRNLLIHRYWEIDDKRLLKETRKGYRDFQVFVNKINELLEKR